MRWGGWLLQLARSARMTSLFPLFSLLLPFDGNLMPSLPLLWLSVVVMLLSCPSIVWSQTSEESASVPSHENPVAPPDWDGMGHYRNTWDLELSGVLGTSFGESESALNGGLDVRVGALWLRGTHFHALGMVAGWLAPVGPWAGLEWDWSSTRTGLWVQLGAGLALEERGVGKVAAGFSLLGVDVRAVSDPENGPEWLVLGHVRVPVRLILLGLTRL